MFGKHLNPIKTVTSSWNDSCGHGWGDGGWGDGWGRRVEERLGETARKDGPGGQLGVTARVVAWGETARSDGLA